MSPMRTCLPALPGSCRKSSATRCSHNPCRESGLWPWHAPAQLVEEVKQHRHVNRAVLLARWPKKHREALAVRRQIQVPYSGGFADLGVRPGTRSVRSERIGFRGIGGNDDIVIRIFVEQLPAVTRS